MYATTNRTRILAGLAAIGLAASLATACRGESRPQRDTTGGPSPAAITPETPAMSFVREPTAPPATAIPAPPAQFDLLRTTVPYQKGKTPASSTLNGSVDIDNYVQLVMRSYRDTWAPVFDAAKLSMPRLTYDVTSRSDRYISACRLGTQQIVVTADNRWLLYCQDDDKPDGAIALPTGALAPLWQNTPRAKDDLVAALSISRQASLILVTSLKRQFGLAASTESQRYHVAACLAGIWAHSVYDQQAFTYDDLATAVERSFAIQLQVDGVITDVSTISPQGITAWLTGFRSGDPAACGEFWE